MKIIFCLLISFSLKAELSNTEIYYVEKIFNTVERALKRVAPKMERNKSKRLSILISLAAKKYKLDPRIMIAIMKIESLFNQKAYNPSGDHSIAQINYRVWKKEFKNLNRPKLVYKRLKKDDAYAIFRMAEILAIEKSRYKGDKWYLTYHSKTKKYRDIYERKFNREFKKLLVFGPDILEKLPKDNLKIANYFLSSQ